MKSTKRLHSLDLLEAFNTNNIDSVMFLLTNYNFKYYKTMRSVFHNNKIEYIQLLLDHGYEIDDSDIEYAIDVNISLDIIKYIYRYYSKTKSLLLYAFKSNYLHIDLLIYLLYEEYFKFNRDGKFLQLITTEFIFYIDTKKKSNKTKILKSLTNCIIIYTFYFNKYWYQTIDDIFYYPDMLPNNESVKSPYFDSNLINIVKDYLYSSILSNECQKYIKQNQNKII